MVGVEGKRRSPPPCLTLTGSYLGRRCRLFTECKKSRMSGFVRSAGCHSPRFDASPPFYRGCKTPFRVSTVSTLPAPRSARQDRPYVVRIEDYGGWPGRWRIDTMGLIIDPVRVGRYPLRGYHSSLPFFCPESTGHPSGKWQNLTDFRCEKRGAGNVDGKGRSWPVCGQSEGTGWVEGKTSHGRFRGSVCRSIEIS